MSGRLRGCTSVYHRRCTIRTSPFCAAVGTLSDEVTVLIETLVARRILWETWRLPLYVVGALLWQDLLLSLTLAFAVMLIVSHPDPFVKTYNSSSGTDSLSSFSTNALCSFDSIIGWSTSHSSNAGLRKVLRISSAH